MQSARTKFSVGLFVIIGMSLVIAFVLWLGMSEYFSEGRTYAAYFDESVQGLSQDAAVKYRGVNVGRVDRIDVAPDGRLVEIVFTITKKLRDPDNLVAQIKSVGITGIMFVELERQPPHEQVRIPDYNFTPKHPVIATRPSEMKQFLSDLYEILSRIKQVDIGGISNQLSSLIENMNRTIVSAEVKKVSAGLQQVIENSNRLFDAEKWEAFRRSLTATVDNLNGLIGETRQAVERLDARFASSAGAFDTALTDVSQLTEKAEGVLEAGTRALEAARNRASDYDRQLIEILEDLQIAAANLNRLLEQLNRQPSRLLYGPPLPGKPVAPEKE